MASGSWLKTTGQVHASLLFCFSSFCHSYTTPRHIKIVNYSTGVFTGNPIHITLCAATGSSQAVREVILRRASLQRVIVVGGCNIRFKTVDQVTKPRIRVLIAEDHPIVADGIVAILAKAKDMVVVGRARDGAEAIELVKQHQPDIVLLDLRMPVVDGIGVASWINESGSTARAIFLTMFHSEKDVSQALRAGVEAYLLKNSPAAEILKTIRDVHRRKERILHNTTEKLAPSTSSVVLNSLESKILALVVRGDDNRTIGVKLGLRTDAVKYNLRGLFSKLGVKKRAAAARRAIELGFPGTGF